jgi:RNA recognition motif-containing protein
MPKSLLIVMFDPALTEDDLRDEFEEYGEILEVKVDHGRTDTKRSRGRAVITYAEDADADAAMAARDRTILEGRQIRISVAGPNDP